MSFKFENSTDGLLDYLVTSPIAIALLPERTKFVTNGIKFVSSTKNGFFPSAVYIKNY